MRVQLSPSPQNKKLTLVSWYKTISIPSAKTLLLLGRYGAYDKTRSHGEMASEKEIAIGSAYMGKTLFLGVFFAIVSSNHFLTREDIIFANPTLGNLSIRNSRLSSFFPEYPS